jgi:AbrB family looped-hinge helix DNA binding protein
MAITIKVSKKNQIAVPAAARERLNIRDGDRLLVDIQDGMLILMPVPKSYTQALSGLHREVWEGIDTEGYIAAERKEWDS